MEALRKEGIALVAISYDSEETLKRFAAIREIAFPLLSDPESETIKAYGVLREDGDGLPHPSIFLIDEAGVIRAKLRHEGYRIRHSAADILVAVRSLSLDAESGRSEDP